MSAKTIKGITVEINGKTTGLGAALKEVDKQASGLNSNLKAVNKALQMDPANTELLAEKQKILANSVEATKEKLETLKSVQDQISQQYKNGEIGQSAYLDFQKELGYTEEKLKNLQKQQKEFGSVAKQVMEEAAQKVSEYGDKVKSAGEKISGVGNSLMPVTAAVVGIGTAAATMGSDMEESQNKVDVAFKESAEQVHAFADSTLEAYGIAEATALDMAALYGDMATSMGLPDQAAADMSTSLVGLAGDLASFKNIDLETAQNALKGIFTGETESLKNLGIVMNQDTLLSYALANGFIDTSKSAQELEKQQLAVEKAQVAYNKAVKKYGSSSLEAREASIKLTEAQSKLDEETSGTLDSLSQAEMVQLRYAYVMEQTANAQGDFSRTSDGAANSMRMAQEAIKEAGANFGVLLTPYVAEAAQYIAQLVKNFADLPEEQKKTIITIAAVVAAVAPLLSIVGKTISVGGSLISGVGKLIEVGGKMAPLFGKIGTALSALATNPVVLIIAGIVALVAILVTAYNKCEWFRDGVNNAITGAKEVWANSVEGIKALLTGLGELWESVTTDIKNAADVTMTAARDTVRERLTSIQSAYEENGGGIRGIAAAANEAVKGYFTDGLIFVDKLTGGKLSGIADSFKNKLSEAAGWVKEQIEKIKGFFDFSWSLPKLEMPHFSISGEFSLNPLSVPKIGVEWYREGGILNGAQIFGAMGGKLLAGGEAGKEAVLPLTEFYSELEAIMTKFRGSSGLVVQVNIEHFENTSGQDVDEFTQQVAQKLQFEVEKWEAGLA